MTQVGKSRDSLWKSPLHQVFVWMVSVQSFVFYWKHLGDISTFLSCSLPSCDISRHTFCQYVGLKVSLKKAETQGADTDDTGRQMLILPNKQYTSGLSNTWNCYRTPRSTKLNKSDEHKSEGKGS